MQADSQGKGGGVVIYDASIGSAVESAANWLTDFFGDWQGYLFSYIAIPLLVIAGVLFTWLGGGAQIRLFITSLKTIRERATTDSAVSPFQALMISTASRVGTGNIAGVTAAIIAGGPSAVFWMWLMASLGAASALVESTLAQVYKQKMGKEFRGGPSYYMQRALKQRWMGVVFAIALIACYAWGFNALQANKISGVTDAYVAEGSHTLVHVIVGVVLAIITGVTIYLGQKAISWVTSVLVPIMAVLYLAMGAIIILKNAGEIPGAFGSIFSDVFTFKAGAGGFMGTAIMWGIKRGLFSNEAGMGSAPNAAASADTSHPVKQGLVQMLSVFIDTMVICSTTALMVLTSGVVWNSDSKDMTVVQDAVKLNLGSAGQLILTISVLLFAFSSIIGNYYYTESNMFFILKRRSNLHVFRGAVVLVVFWGAIQGYDLAWNTADFLMAIMAIINLVAILLLAPRARAVIKDFYAQRKAGKDPTFIAAEVGITDTDWWKPGMVTLSDQPEEEPAKA
ncbi:MAG: alanine:cation symporter family protein [Bifidobacteriaceae bacterium]|jgi:AGCS family alanine or glycine:cation symporter|nr:alanine:cation symporter family protein [Bifidobacteriaceae bacterium]